MEEKKPLPGKKKRLFTVILVVCNVLAIGIPLIIELSGGDSAADIRSLNINMLYLIPAMGCFVVALLAAWVRYMFLMHASCGRYLPRLSLHTCIIGRYYDAVTPSGSGGQPFQIYYLTKDNAPREAVGTLPIAAFVLNQAAFTIIAIIVLISGASIGRAGVMASAFLGSFMYIAIPAAIVLFTFLPGVLSKFISGLLKLLGKLKIMKHPEETAKNWTHTLEVYRTSFMQLRKEPAKVLTALFFSIIYYCAIHSAQGIRRERIVNPPFRIHHADIRCGSYSPHPGQLRSGGRSVLQPFQICQLRLRILGDADLAFFLLLYVHSRRADTFRHTQYARF